MIESKVESLKDLYLLRTAPTLNKDQTKSLFKELCLYMNDAEWFTVGIMAKSSKEAISSLRQIENCFKWQPMKLGEQPFKEGPVFLKANQNSGDIHIRIEHGLGEGILISCQHKKEDLPSETLGPFPLDFFKA